MQLSHSTHRCAVRVQAFSHLLQLPPIPLEILEAAILPGPLPRSRRAHPPLAAPPAGLGGLGTIAVYLI